MSRGTAVLWSADDAARATQGRAIPDATGDAAWVASGVSIDSRGLCAQDLFVALIGPKFDGHDFVAEALGKGAAAAVVSRIPQGLPAGAPLLVVEDTLQALVDLGRAARRRSRARVIGVTGSVGKTSVKEALNLVLAAQASTVASQGSLNNHWGLPLSLARVPRDAVFAVLEMGMNHPGEIAPLAQMAAPDVAVVTTVEAVHKAHFASVEAIADAKAEIFSGVRAGGTAVLNRDNPHYARLAAAADRAGIRRIVTFGRHAAAEVRLVGAEPGSEGSRVQARWAGGTLDFLLSVPGNHWIMNSLCVLATVAAAGADVPAAAAALRRVAPPKGRGQSHAVGLAGGVLHLIDDSYNASPVSVAASLDVLGRGLPGPGGRRIAVLGDMLELGNDSAALHAALAGPLRQNGIDLVFTAGPMMAHLFAALPAAMRGGHAENSLALAPLVAATVRPCDIVSVKGSAGSRMDVVVRALAALEHTSRVAPAAGGR
jgi:UDP-N-acetylmuramoyl-tripeptide--D-alanyl-D-alanine ligase